MTFYENLSRLYRDKGNLPLEKERDGGWKYFLQHASSPIFQKIRPLAQTTFNLATKGEITKGEIDSHIYPECRGRVLVFIDGFFSEEHSDCEALKGQWEVMPLSSAYRIYPLYLERRFSEEKEGSPFAALNTAIHPEGAFLYFPPQSMVGAPLQILFISTESSSSLISPRVHLFVGAGATVSAYFSSVVRGNPEKCWVNAMIDIVCERQSSLSLFNHVTSANWHLETIRVKLKEEAQFESSAFLSQGELIRQEYRVALEGTRSSAKIGGAFSLKGRNEVQIEVGVDHLAEAAISSQSFKGVLSDTSRSTFKGRIYVKPEAQKTESYQISRSLLVSEGAKAVAEPILEIFADDVKASHGATVGQVDKESLFYLKTRGFSDEEAKALLIKAFLRDMIDAVPLASLRQTLLLV